MNEHKRTEFISIPAYDKNLEGLTKFLLWLDTQDTSSWEYTAKPIPKVTTYGGYGNYGSYYGMSKPVKGKKRKALSKDERTLDNLLKALIPSTPLVARNVFNAYFSKNFLNLEEGMTLLNEAYKKGYICDELSQFRYILTYGEL